MTTSAVAALAANHPHGWRWALSRVVVVIDMDCPSEQANITAMRSRSL